MSNGNGPVFESKPGWGGKIGAWVSKNMLYVIPGVIIVVILIIILASSGGPNTATPTTSSSPEFSVPPTLGDATETILKGDSYTTVARRIVAMSNVASSIPTAGAKLYAETRLAQEIQNQPLVVGGSIKYNQKLVLPYLTTDYSALFPSQRIKWEAMAKNVKF